MPHHAKLPQLKRLRDDSLLDISDSIIAGRHSSCGISLSHEEGASRKHARFNYKDGQLTITDLGSLNGTLVNGIEIDGTHVLKNSDIIIFDSEKYLLKLPKKSRRAREFTSSTADTVIANKAERINPDSITPAIRIIADESNTPANNNHQEKQNHNAAHADQSGNTMEYLQSMPAPDMKRPVGMPEYKVGKKPPHSAFDTVKKWSLPVIVILVLVVAAYQLGLQGT